MDGEGPCAAEGRRAAVHHQDGQQVHVLLLTVESGALRPDAGCVVYRETREQEETNMRLNICNLLFIYYNNACIILLLLKNKGSVLYKSIGRAFSVVCKLSIKLSICSTVLTF